MPVLTDAPIGEFLATVRRLDTVVTADTLALHAAAAFGVPVIAVVGPMPTGELELGPADQIIGPALPCAPCYLHCTRPVAGECMTLIDVNQVAAAVTTHQPHRPQITSSGQPRRGPRSSR